MKFPVRWRQTYYGCADLVDAKGEAIRLADINALGTECARLKAENAALHERLEDNFAWRYDEAGNPHRVEHTPGSIHDGIECRDQTIKGQDEAIAGLKAELEEARQLLRKLREWANDRVGASWQVHDAVNPGLFDAVDKALAAIASPTQKGES